MTRRSKREIERALDDIAPGSETGLQEVTVRHHAVPSNPSDGDSDLETVRGFRTYRDGAEWATEPLSEEEL